MSEQTAVSQILKEAVVSPNQETDVAAPRVEIELGDKMRTLSLNLNVLIRIEELTGKGFMRGELFKMSASDVRAFVWACVVEDEPTVTLREVGSWIDMENIPEVMESIPKLLSTWQSEDARMLAPFVPTPEAVIDKAFELAGPVQGCKVYDLGAGDGRVLFAAADRNALSVVGCEINEERFKDLKKSISDRDLQSVVTVVNTPIQDMNLRDADLVFVYLLTTSNSIIRPQLEAQLKPGARVISHDFPFQGWEPAASEVIEADGRAHAIYFYKIGAHYPEGQVQ